MAARGRNANATNADQAQPLLQLLARSDWDSVTFPRDILGDIESLTCGTNMCLDPHVSDLNVTENVTEECHRIPVQPGHGQDGPWWSPLHVFPPIAYQVMGLPIETLSLPDE
ncbi:hypothetical protein [Oryza sativa Japonica Group]|uniref:Uncharacterized protein n=1 Tax=Oryza sativa subsp. japonica TaxID=39947 RepID=Q656U2_ORYSJ|nr:hypothetical protein [Oryza sativa Japonica Group]BAD45175.1 hypothetical protein [Oryza sativa Japonica Group]